MTVLALASVAAARSLPAQMGLAVHITAGATGIVAGFIALYAAKGQPLHRKVGMVFVYAMITMGLMGSLLAAVRDKAPGANIPIGLLTAYLAITALGTVRPSLMQSRGRDIGLMMVVLGVTVWVVTSGVSAAMSATGTLYGMPPAPFFIFGAIAALATAGDARLIRAGGIRTIRGTPRLARHLWRMCVALLIAAFSFFLGQAKVIPKPIRIFPLLVIPPLVVLVTLLYWLWRVRAKRSSSAFVATRVVQAGA